MIWSAFIYSLYDIERHIILLTSILVRHFYTSFRLWTNKCPNAGEIALMEIL